jgi:hypothetical protein
MIIGGDGKQPGTWNRPFGNLTEMDQHRPGGEFGPGNNGGGTFGGGGGGVDGSDIEGGGNGEGGGSFDPMKPGGIWQPGIVPKEMDVNECSAFPGLCGHGRCRNMAGTFICDCFPGYEPVSYLLFN